MDSTCKNGLETVLLTLFLSILMCPTQIWPTPFLLTATNKIGGILMNFQFALPKHFCGILMLVLDWSSVNEMVLLRLLHPSCFWLVHCCFCIPKKLN